MNSRLKTILRVLAKTYPDAWCALRYRNAWELLMGSILSSQSTNRRVNEITPSLFQKYPDARAMARADLRDLEEKIRSVGLYRVKARALVLASRMLVEKHGGKVPKTLEELVALPGVGRKTANLVLSTALDIPGVIVNTHMIRTSRRLGLSEEREPERIERDLKRILPEREWTLFSHRMIAHGRKICHARKPDCGSCALAPVCPSRLIA